MNGLPIIAICLIGFAISATGAVDYASYGTSHGFRYRQGDCPGNDISSSQSTSLDTCTTNCKQTSGCVAFLWHDANHCYLKRQTCSSIDARNSRNHFFDKANVCNGIEGLCKLKFNQVTFPGTHNSGANRVMKYKVGLIMVAAMSCFYRNQDYSFPAQLDFGIRFFDIDTRSKGGKAFASHSTTYGSELSVIMREITDWLNQDSHRNEVIAIRFHDSDISSSDFGQIKGQLDDHFKNGVKANDQGNWPTLQQAVDANKRVFVFVVDKLCDSSCRTSSGYIRPATDYGDTYKYRKMTSSCSGVVADTREKCTGMSEPLSLVSIFGSEGLCVSDMMKLCNRYIPDSSNACYEERKKNGKTVNFITADYVNQAATNENVVTVARDINTKNLQVFG